jgi:hypothetical protein
MEFQMRKIIASVAIAAASLLAGGGAAAAALAAVPAVPVASADMVYHQ